jgi:predicted extracellular nuclease
VRRQLLAVLTAAFLLFQQAIIFAPAASAQTRRATAVVDKTTPTKAPISSGVRTPPAPILDDPGPPNDTGTGSIFLGMIDAATPTETFNTLSNTAGSTTNSTLPTGWYITETGGGARDNEQYAVDTGGSNTGDTYSYGSAASTDRALGGLQSGTLIPVIGAKFTNNTGVTITSLDISYTGEQWRISNTAAARDDRMDFQYSLNATDLSAGTYTDVNALDFTNPIKTATTAGALDGNNAANRTARSSTITGLSIPNGATFFIRWNDLNASGADDGLAVDDFSVTPRASVNPTFAINDVSQDEGNAGTTAFTFTVSLSTSTHSGVTFDICTVDGTAQDGDNVGEDTDYAAACLGGQTIPNGSNSYQFTVNVNGDATTEPNETFFVNVANVVGATVTDAQGQGTIQNDDLTVTPIHDIQGNGAASPFAGQTVTTTGIVTLLRTGTNNGGAANSFFIQTPDGSVDADPNTSQGLLVFTGSAPTVAVGDSVRVTGTATEFFNMTEISPTTNVTVLSTGNSLPTAVTLTTTILDPTASPSQPQLEKYEGMRLTAASLVTVAPNDNFYEVETVLGGVPRPMREPGIEISTPSVPPDPGEATPDCCIPRWDENPERIKVDTNGRAGAPLNPYRSDLTFSNPTGPLDFSFGEYKLIPEQTPTVLVLIPTPAAPQPAADEFTVVSYNIENFNNNATQRQKVAQTVRGILNYPDIIGAIEIDDLSHLQALRDEINNNAVTWGDPNPMYEAYLVEGNSTSGGDVDQNVAFLVKTARVQVNAVTQERKDETYVPPGGTETFLHDRPPLVLDATVDPSGTNPQHVFVVVNHLRSFICIDADADPAVAAGCDGGAADGPRVRAKRKAQAESLADLLNDLQAANPGVPVISVGDYNAYQFTDGFTDPVKTVKGLATVDNELAVDASPDLVNPDFVNLTDTLPALERYTFIFEGTPQVLDHHIVNAAARSRNTRTAIAHINADFPEAPAAAYANNAAVVERNSDHDPVVSYYRLGAAQAAGSLVISEFRFRGPGPSVLEAGPVSGDDPPGGPNAPGTPQDNDEFVEIYNNTDADITVTTLDGSAGWAVVAADGVTRFIIPNDTVIPARGNFLGVNLDGFSLDAYATPDDVLLPSDTSTLAGGYTLDIPDGSGLALFGTADPANYTLGNRLDAAGYATVDPLYREGAGFPASGAEATSDLEYSFVRRVCVFGGTGCGQGLPKDSGDNGADFVVVNTDAAPTTLGAKLGAPGPQGSTSPVNGNGQILGTLLDPSVSASQPPNRVRDFTMVPNGTFGTLSIRRTLTNNTGSPVYYLAFRIIDITTNPAPTGTADLRAIDSDDIQVTVNGNPVDVFGTFVEQPPVQPNGGGLNSSMAVGSVNFETPIEPGASVNVQFLLGIQQTGNYRFYVSIEMLNDEFVPEGSASPAAPLFNSHRRKFRQEQRQQQRPRRNN